MLDTPDVLILRGIVVNSSRQREDYAQRLLGGISAWLPGRRWMVPAIVPERLATAFFHSNGFRRATISRLEMTYDLRHFSPVRS